MKPRMPIYALAAAIVLAGLLVAGVASSIISPVLLAGSCTLMMFVMMRGMSGMHDDHRDHRDDTHDHGADATDHGADGTGTRR